MCFWLLLILLFILAVSSVPAYPYSRSWGYYPSGGFIVLVVILLILWWLAMLPGWGHYTYWR
jgi:hypothetical protein